MLPIVDVNLWSRLLDGTLLVVREGVTPVKALKRGLQALDHPKLIGVVINEANGIRPSTLRRSISRELEKRRMVQSFFTAIPACQAWKNKNLASRGPVHGTEYLGISDHATDRSYQLLVPVHSQISFSCSRWRYACSYSGGCHRRRFASWLCFREANRFLARSTAPICGLILLAVLVSILYGRVLESMAQQWWSDPNYGHGLLVPVFAAYVLWRERKWKREVPIHASNWGVAIMLFAIGPINSWNAWLGALHSPNFFPISDLRINCVSGRMAGASVGRLSGWLSRLHDSVARNYLLPIDISSAIARLAARCEWFSRSRSAHRARRESAYSSLIAHSRSWKPAVGSDRCSLCWPLLSVTSIWSSQAPGNAAYWSPLMVPIVILSNGLRLVATGVLSFYFGPGADSGLAHTGLGLVFFALAFLSAILVHSLLRRFKSKRILAPVH